MLNLSGTKRALSRGEMKQPFSGYEAKPSRQEEVRGCKGVRHPELHQYVLVAAHTFLEHKRMWRLLCCKILEDLRAVQINEVNWTIILFATSRYRSKYEMATSREAHESQYSTACYAIHMCFKLVAYYSAHLLRLASFHATNWIRMRLLGYHVNSRLAGPRAAVITSRQSHHDVAPAAELKGCHAFPSFILPS